MRCPSVLNGGHISINAASQMGVTFQYIRPPKKLLLQVLCCTTCKFWARHVFHLRKPPRCCPCRSGHKQSTDVTFLADAVQHGARILTGAYAERLLLTEAAPGCTGGVGVRDTGGVVAQVCRPIIEWDFRKQQGHLCCCKAAAGSGRVEGV